MNSTRNAPPPSARAPQEERQADRVLLMISPFGPFYGRTRPAPAARARHKPLWRQGRARRSRECENPVFASGPGRRPVAAQAAQAASQSIYLLDPSPTTLRLVEQIGLTEQPNRYYLTCWQAPGGVRHTKISFLVDTPEEALRLLQTAARAWEQPPPASPH